MEKLEYESSLKKDIESVVTKNKKIDIIIKAIIIAILVDVPLFSMFFALTLLDPANIDTHLNILKIMIAPLNASIITIYSAISNKLRIKKANEASDRIDCLARTINPPSEEKIHTVYRPTITNEESLVESIQVESKYLGLDYEDIITDFYSLDFKDRLLVLREVRHHIKEGKFKRAYDEYSLCLLNEEDLPENLPVVRHLEVVSKEIKGRK